MAKLPVPPPKLSLAATVVTLGAGTRLFRVYHAAGPHPATWNGFRHFGPTTSRFDHHDPPPHLQARGILYAASDPTTCLAEIFQATRVIDRAAAAPWLVAFDLTRTLSLLDLTGAWPTRAGASMVINSGPRPRVRLWSRAIYASYPRVDGVLYASSMHANQPAVALYECAGRALPVAPVFHRALMDPAVRPRIDGAATRLGYGVV